MAAGPGDKKKTAGDRQLTALSGKFFVAAELLKRGLQGSVTFRNAKAIDLFAHNPQIGRTVSVQVSALRRKNLFSISNADVKRDCVYVFVLLNKPGEPVEYFIVPGDELSRNPERFGNWFRKPKKDRPGINPRFLKTYTDNWEVFNSSVPSDSVPR